MEVTEEMIKAVTAHKVAQMRDARTKARQERLRKYGERADIIRADALRQARLTFPGMTEDQFEELEDVFRDYFDMDDENW